jgi:hypothetical protein
MNKIFIKIMVLSIFTAIQIPLYVDANTDRKGITCTEFYLPFASFQNRESFKELSKRSLDGFGAYRKEGTNTPD